MSLQNTDTAAIWNPIVSNNYLLLTAQTLFAAVKFKMAAVSVKRTANFK